MSYRIDAEVNDCSYGCTYTRNDYASQDDFLAKKKLFIEGIKREFSRRTNSATWFVSNCDSRFRMNFASILKTHFPLKIIGSCAKYICSLNESWFRNFLVNLIQPSCERHSKCESVEFGKNKFYLSFESKNCTNYMTEKIWRILRTGLIPVVVQPAKVFYDMNLPADSFIHAEDFGYDPVRLAAYLDKVSNDLDLYYKHLEWKMHASVVYSGLTVERRRNCELCTRLNLEDRVVYYESVSKWFNYKCVVN
jgi:hypothetical protein